MPPELSVGRQRAILALLATTVLIVVMDLTIINVALNSIQHALHASNAQLQWSLDSYLITFAAFLFTGGVLADRFGRKRTLLGGLVVFGVSSVLGAYSGGIGALIVWRTIMGIGAAAVPTVTLTILMVVFPPAQRPKAIALWAAAAGVAFAVGPVLGGVLLQNFWWGSIFLINAPLAVVGVVLIAWLVPESKNPAPPKFDPLGVVMSVAAIGLLVYGIVRGGENDHWLSAGTLAALIGGVVLVAALVAVERRMPNPSLDVSLLRSSRFSAGTAAIALCFFSLLGAIFVTQFYYQAVMNFSAIRSGLLMVPMGIGSLFMSSRCPALAARFGPRAVVAGGSIVMAVSFVLSSTFGTGTSTWLLIVAQLVFGLGWGCIMAPATASLMSVVPLPKAGAGQAVSQTFRQVAGALGVAVIGSILGVVYRSSMGDSVNVLPKGMRSEAAGSIGNTLQAVQSAKLGSQAPALVHKAVDSYLSGMQITLLVAAAVALLSAAVSLRWLPNQAPKPPVPPTAPPKPAAEAVGDTAGAPAAS
jgi:EmrB/QacA subfamily drug resistance transporter